MAKNREVIESADVGRLEDALGSNDPLLSEAAAPVISPQADPPPAELPSVTVDIFAQATGRKRNAYAGFAHWAKRQGHEVHTIPEWTALFDTFMGSAP